MRRKLIITGILTGILVLLVGLGVYTQQTASAAALTTENISPSTLAFSGEAIRGQGLPGVDDEYLAGALGITTDELDAARQEARQAALAAAVEQDLITQAQADAFNSGDLAFPLGRWSGWLEQNGINFDTFLADALGISVEQLQEARITALNARIDQAVADGKLTEDQALLMKARFALANSQNFKDSMQSAFKAAVQQAVDDGLITQQQADLLLEKAAQFDMPGFGGPGLFDGMRGGPRPHRGFPGDFSSSDQTETP
jgi:hypothetical protein